MNEHDLTLSDRDYALIQDSKAMDALITGGKVFDVEDLLLCVDPAHPMTMERLEKLPRRDNDLLNFFRSEGLKPQDIVLEETDPPEELYYSVEANRADDIEAYGIEPDGGQFVRLAEDADAAESLYTGRGRPVVFLVRASEMADEGVEFYRLANGIWLTKAVPENFLELYSD